MSGIVNKIKDAVHGDKTHHTSEPEGTHGPHNTRTGNAMDPRVDSDRDHSSTVGAGRTTGTHAAGVGAGSTGYGAGSTGYNTGTAEGTHGPHGSRVANAMDPRVDSDRDNSRTVGGTGRTAGHGEFGSTGYTGTGTGTGTGFGSATHHTGTAAGVGSGLGSSTHHTTGAGSGVTGMTGTHGAPEGTYGPHSSRMANAADPRVDSDRDNRGARGMGGGPGPAPNTAGPHKSDMANKMDPRVDSDLDGSKTMGGNRTYQSGNESAYRDPTDAAQVPPSVLQKHVGGPVLEHEDSGHHRERRNSVKTHQETFRGI